MDALLIRQEREIIEAYEEWKCSNRRFGLKREPVIITGAGYEKEPTIIPKGKRENPHCHTHVCEASHPWFEIPCVNPACWPRPFRAIECPECGHVTEHYLPNRRVESELISPYEPEQTAAA